MKEDYKKQHVVPQSYLKRFAETGNNGVSVIGTRCESNKQDSPKLFKQSVSNVGYIDNYYDVDSKPPKYWEHFLGKNIDVLYGKPLSNIISNITLACNDANVLSNASIDILAKIIVSQFARVPSFLDKTLSQSKPFLEKSQKELLKYIDINRFSKEVIREANNISYSEDERLDMILESIFDEKRMKQYCNILKNRIWIYYYNNDTLFPFITSDNPVLMRNLVTHKSGNGENGIGRNDTVIFFPISPKILVGLYPSSAYLGRLRKFNNRVVPINAECGDFISSINTGVMDQSYKHSFIPETLFSQL